MNNLFTAENKIEIIEIKASDILRETDVYKAATSLILSHEDKYPGIDKWFKNKVRSGIKEQSRGMYIGFNNNIPIATSIVKKGKDAKFCHLHIEEDLRHNNLGDVFFILMSLFVKQYAERVHFSLPEALWEDKKHFFTSFGFNKIEKNKTQYRSGEEELAASVDFNLLWSKVLDKIPELFSQFAPNINSSLNGIVMSINPQYSKQILKGEKVVEIRKKFNSKWKDHVVTIYSTNPTKEIVGFATVEKVIEDMPESIWSLYSNKLGCSKSEFDSYTNGTQKVFAIFLSDVNRFDHGISLAYLSSLFEKKITPPQSYLSVRNSEWGNVLSLTEVLRGRLSKVLPII